MSPRLASRGFAALKQLAPRRGQNNLAMLCLVRFVLCGPNHAFSQIHFRPTGRHDFIEPGAREHQQLDHASEPKWIPPWAFFFAAQTAASQAPRVLHIVDAISLENARFLCMGFRELEAPAPNLGQPEGEEFPGSGSRSLGLGVKRANPKRRLINILQTPPRKRGFE